MPQSQAEMIEFALRFADEDKSHDKLITVPSSTTVHQVKQYIMQSLIPRMNQPPKIRGGAAKNQYFVVTKDLIRAQSVRDIQLFVRVRKDVPAVKIESGDVEVKQEVDEDDKGKDEMMEIKLENGKMHLQELVTRNIWRQANLTPGLDLMENFWDVALKEDNYETIREKLFFRVVKAGDL